MKLQSATIKNFKRFTDLTISNIPPAARLIMLAGPNGCGKSSLFDAFNIWHRRVKRPQYNPGWQIDYHSKVTSLTDRFNDQVEVTFHEGLPENDDEKKKIFYIRSAYRNDPEFRIQQLTSVGSSLDEETVQRMIDNDAAVSRNYQRMASQGLEDLYEAKDGRTTFAEYREESIGDIREALLRLFPDLELHTLGNPLAGGTFRFTKGASEGFAFTNLSGGEKAAFDLILDIAVRGREYDNTVFCIDEPESHMNARLQADLLEALYGLIPANCQLFLTTHSIGMMRRAIDIEKRNPGEVVFLDFGNRDFDQLQIIEPTTPNRRFWQSAYEVALDDLSALVAPRKVILCEGQPLTSRPTRNHSHDARCYETIFGDEFPEIRFVSVGGDNEVLNDKRGLVEILHSIVNGLEVVRLIDRDDRADVTIAEERKKSVRVLSRRNLESYLYDDEVLTALAKSVGQEEKAEGLLEAKRQFIASASGPSNDLKQVSGLIYNECKSSLNLTQCGNNAAEFARVTLAPLVKTGSSVYKELRSDIFD